MAMKAYQIALLGSAREPAIIVERDSEGAPIRVVPQGARAGTREILPTDPNYTLIDRLAKEVDKLEQNIEEQD
jgi:hypothetical protein